MGPRSRKMESGHGEDPWMSEISPDKEPIMETSSGQVASATENNGHFMTPVSEEGGSLEDDLGEHSASTPMELDDMDADEEEDDKLDVPFAEQDDVYYHPVQQKVHSACRPLLLTSKGQG
ncbi:hypothetical protein JZ751_022934 [Albula glossodonta]|uniref:Uncharacterized protein n=1 Tax=Albula glossodonta TaxID=121402 RepID=A0A8T2PEC0_9TELE|nr:hypothetical protein JZ751_022934 [Albula glossodonta]